MTSASMPLDVGAAPRPVAREDIAPLASVLAQAFDADPFVNWFVVQDHQRQARFEDTFRIMLERMSRQLNASFTTRRREGCAVWKRPGEHAIGWRQQLGLLPAFARVMGWRGIPRFLKLVDYSQALHDQLVPEPHYYLFVLGVHPQQQSRGVGTRLLQPILERCDVENRRAYLETARAENLPFYARHGFQVAHVIEKSGFPKLWLMVRSPSGATAEQMLGRSLATCVPGTPQMADGLNQVTGTEPQFGNAPVNKYFCNIMNAMGLQADANGYPAKDGPASEVTRFGYSDKTEDFCGGAGAVPGATIHDPGGFAALKA